jgi:hypothetical protein
MSSTDEQEPWEVTDVMSTQKDTSHNGGKVWPEPPTGSNSSGESAVADWHTAHYGSHRKLFIMALAIIILQVLNVMVITYGLVTR